MSLQNNIMAEMKVAMKNKNKTTLEALRAIKAAILLAQTDTGAKKNLSEAEENKILQKLAKQRKESIEIFTKEHRSDLAEKEIAQLDVIEKFLPKQMSQEDLEKNNQSNIKRNWRNFNERHGQSNACNFSKNRGCCRWKNNQFYT